MQYHEPVAASYVLDTDVMVAALRSDRGASRQLLLAALNRRFELLLSVPLILGYLNGVRAYRERPESTGHIEVFDNDFVDWTH